MTDDDPQRVSRPGKTTEYRIVVSGTRVRKDWDECVRAAANNMAEAWDALTKAPMRVSRRQMQLRGAMSHRTCGGIVLEQWQYEFTSGGRLIYLIDPAPVRSPRGKVQAAGTVIVVEASVGHPKKTERVRGSRRR